jgi:hypothetical protein
MLFKKKLDLSIVFQNKKDGTLKRLFFDYDNDKLYTFDNSHVEHYHNNKKKFVHPFDYYIRGIVNDDVLYLRLFYPLQDIDDKNLIEIKAYSIENLTYYNADIVKHLKREGIKIKKTIYNVSNEDLKNIFNLTYV